MLKLPNTMKTLTTLPPDAEDITDIMTLDTKDMTNNIMTNNITQCPADIPDININPKDNDKITPNKDHENITTSPNIMKISLITSSRMMISLTTLHRIVKISLTTLTYIMKISLTSSLKIM